MRRAGVGARRHGGHVAGFQQEEAGRGGASAAGRDIGDDGNRRRDDLFDRLRASRPSSRRGCSAGPEQGRHFPFSPGRCARGDDLGGDGVDHAVHIDRDDLAARGRRRRAQKRERYRK